MRPGVLAYVGDTLDRFGKAGRALDIGALDVNGNARGEFVRRGWSYTGYDLLAGPNVDVAGPINMLTARFAAELFDAVACLETLEHVEDLFTSIRCMTAVLRPGGLLILTAAANGFPEHRYPVDCWRILPDGMKVLLQGMRDVDIQIHNLEGGPGILARAVK